MYISDLAKDAVAVVDVGDHRHRRRLAGEGHLPPKIREKYFLGKNHVKFRHFVNFFPAYIM